MALPDGLPGELTDQQAGAFVFDQKERHAARLHRHDRANGSNFSRRNHAQRYFAGTADPRFDPVHNDELKIWSTASMVLSAAEPIASERELDVKRYGVIVQSGYRRGLLLPDLEGVDTPQQQML